MLVLGLPPDATTWREGRLWTHQDELQALTVELLGKLCEAWGWKFQGGSIKVPRPDDAKREPEPKSTEAHRALLKLFG